jgi:type VI secretion system protein ImpJ
MSLRNHVIWKDGLFIKPHHFQQQQRYLENLVRGRSDSVDAYQSGFAKIEVNKENLLHGKITLDSAVGIMSDGSFVDIPGQAPPPPALDVSSENVVNQQVFLALPMRFNGIPEIDDPHMPQEAARMTVFQQEVRDIASADTDPFFVDVAQYRFRLMLESEDRSSYTCLPIIKIREKRSDGSLVLDDEFLPVASALEALPRLQKVLDDFVGLLQQRSRQISARLGATGQSGVSDVSDFLMLQAVNRLWPAFRHLASIKNVHPRDLYGRFVESAGELTTFTHHQRMPEAWPAYNHDDLQVCFEPVIRSLRQSLTAIIDANAIALPLERHKYGILTSPVADRSLLTSAIFVVAVKAAVPLEKLAKDFPAQTKVSSIERIRDLINLHLPGVVIQQLPTAPRQLPYHAGFTYFQLDANSAGWDHIKDASGFAFHIAGNFPELDIQFWAIRNERNS